MNFPGLPSLLPLTHVLVLILLSAVHFLAYYPPNVIKFTMTYIFTGLLPHFRVRASCVYVDPGNSLPCCHQPWDMLCAIVLVQSLLILSH